MNGRVYDPVLGRFLSADPVLQFPENSQSYNKYSYVMNNPMRYVDPSGYEMSEWQFQSMMYMHSRSWQRYLNESGITGMDDFAYGMGVEAGMEALIHSVSPSSGGGGGVIDEGNGPPDADELEDRTLGGSGDGDDNPFTDGVPSNFYSKADYARLSLADRELFIANWKKFVLHDDFLWLSDAEANSVFSTTPSLTYLFGSETLSIIYDLITKSVASVSTTMFFVYLEIKNWGNSQVLDNYNAQPIGSRNGVYVKTYNTETIHGGYQRFTYVYDAVTGSLLGMWWN